MMPLPLRLAWRELRGGLRGFGVFIACIVLGVMAIAGVGSVAESLSDGLSAAGRVILGGDLAFSLIQREATADERAFLDAHGTVSVAATLRAMARTRDSRSALVEVKAVDDDYPLFGTATTDPALPLASVLAKQGDAFGAAADPALFARLDLKPGDRITIGSVPIELRAALTSEPDKLAGGIGFGPRLLISEAALRASGLLQPGSLVRWQYRLRLPEGAASEAAVAAARTTGPGAIPRRRLGNPHPPKGFAAARAQRRAFQPISHPRRLDRASGRRRRRRQCGRRQHGAQARRDRHLEGARRDRRRHLRRLLRARSCWSRCSPR